MGTPLANAVKGNRTVLVKLLLGMRGIDVDMPSIYRKRSKPLTTPLHAAAKGGFTEMLIESGSKLDSQDENG